MGANFLVAGLGNIGAEYSNTRHNMGFMVLDAWAKASNIVFRTARYGSVAEVSFKGRRLTLLKPSTYMNLSGKAVRYWMSELKIPIENLIVISDDLNLPFGTLRMRKNGSAGGHNGLANITELLGTQDYARVRVGIGNNFSRGSQIDFVLGEELPGSVLVAPVGDEVIPAGSRDHKGPRAFVELHVVQFEAREIVAVARIGHYKCIQRTLCEKFAQAFASFAK